MDIQQEMLDIIRKRMKERKVTNVEPVLGTEHRPEAAGQQRRPDPDGGRLPRVRHPYEMTEAMVKALKPGGRLVFVEYRLEDPNVPIKLVHKMTEKQVIKEMGPHPLKYVKTHTGLPWQHVIVFEKKAG